MTYKHVKKVGEKYYLYEITGVWDPVKKNSKQTRRYIGPCDADGNLQDSRKRNLPAVSQTFGPYWLLLSIGERTGLWSELEECFGEELGEQMKVLSMIRCVRPSALRQTESIFEETFLSTMFPEPEFGSRSLSRLLGRIDEEDRNRFFSHRYDGNDAIVFDLTSFASESYRMDRNEYGDDYRKIHTPQVSMGMVHSASSGVPFCYRLYPGSIADVRTLENMSEFVSAMGCETAHFVMDRGFYSESNLTGMMERNLGFTIPVPGGRKLFKTAVSESIRNISSLDTDFFNGSVIRHWKTSVIIGGRDVDAYVFLDEKRRNDEILSMYSRISTYEKQINGERWTEGIHRELRMRYGTEVLRFLEIGEENGMVRTARKRNAITACENACGRMVVLTTSGDRWDEVLVRYRGRNDVESDFRMLKNDLQGGVRCLQTDLSADGMIFIQFVSLILRCELFRLLRNSRLYGKYWLPDVFNELNKLKATKIGDKWVLNEVSKKQRTMYEALGLKVPTTDSLQSLVTNS